MAAHASPFPSVPSPSLSGPPCSGQVPRRGGAGGRGRGGAGAAAEEAAGVSFGRSRAWAAGGRAVLGHTPGPQLPLLGIIGCVCLAPLVKRQQGLCLTISLSRVVARGLLTAWECCWKWGGRSRTQYAAGRACLPTPSLSRLLSIFPCRRAACVWGQNGYIAREHISHATSGMVLQCKCWEVSAGEAAARRLCHGRRLAGRFIRGCPAPCARTPPLPTPPPALRRCPQPPTGCPPPSLAAPLAVPPLPPARPWAQTTRLRGGGTQKRGRRSAAARAAWPAGSRLSSRLSSSGPPQPGEASRQGGAGQRQRPLPHLHTGSHY